MRRITLALALVALFAFAFATDARADEPAPTPAELDAAKKAFEEGNNLYKQGKLVEAIAKLKESYKLSKNPFLLYNVGKTYDGLGQKESALFYYKKFLALGPANAPMRAEVQRRVDALVAEGVPETDPDAVKVVEAPTVALEHTPVDSAAPQKPIDIVARVPAGQFTVTLFFRRSDDATFTPVPMAPRDADLVGQIPADKVSGNYLQYYIEVKDAAGQTVARAGKSTSPNLINIQGSTSVGGGLELDDPLKDKRFEKHEPPRPPWKREAYIATAGTGALLVTTVVFYMLAKKQSDALKDDAKSCGEPPCTIFDENYDQRLETLGKRYNLLYRVSLGLTVAAGGVTGYFWYRKQTAKKPVVDDRRFTIAPVIGDDFAGFATMGRF